MGCREAVVVVVVVVVVEGKDSVAKQGWLCVGWLLEVGGGGDRWRWR